MADWNALNHTQAISGNTAGQPTFGAIDHGPYPEGAAGSGGQIWWYNGTAWVLTLAEGI